MVQAILLFLLGFVLIIIGGDKFVDAAVAIAKSLGISELIIGATIVSLGTTLPEMLVSTTAALQGSADIAAGNAFGSIICNTGFIAGLILLFRPDVPFNRSAMTRQTLFFFAAAAIITAFGGFVGSYNRLTALCLLVVLVLFVYSNLRNGGGSSKSERNIVPKKMVIDVTILVITAAALFVGARLLVNNGIIIAEALGVPQRVLAVTFIALGTSLPELVTAISALIKGHTAVSVGNILGANIMNLLLVIGIPAAITGIVPSASAMWIDLPVAMFAMAILTLPMIIFKKGNRVQGALLIVGYAVYCFTQF
jgi:cation:H+ antiporter